MPSLGNRDVSCPHCGAVVKTRMSPEISAGENPDLRQRVLDETLFDWKCPECGYEAQLVYPCLYHDSLGGLEAVLPDVSEEIYGKAKSMKAS